MLQRCGEMPHCAMQKKTLTEALQNLRDAHTCEAAEDALKDAQNMMASLSMEKGAIQPVHIDDVLPEVVDRVECRNQGLEKSRTLMTGIDELDAKNRRHGARRPDIHRGAPFDGENRTGAGYHRQSD
ncbi:helicase [Escherichia coli]|uniref:Helicase n=1 Tax=Escherichia coli TaxID=562 RepID=A0A376KPE8_ECOLX|nr:helicase [Escherichia coli]